MRESPQIVSVIDEIPWPPKRLCPDFQGISQRLQQGDGGEVRQFSGARVGFARFILKMNVEPAELADDLDVMHISGTAMMLATTCASALH
jgi:hypothetical protein